MNPVWSNSSGMGSALADPRSDDTPTNLELVDQLAAVSAGVSPINRPGVDACNGDRDHAPLALSDDRRDGIGLGTDGAAVGRVFDIAPGDDFPRRGQDRCPNPEV